MIKNENRILMADSYKYSHPKQYPEMTVSMYDYAEARSGKVYALTAFVGLQGILQEYFTTPISETEVEEAKQYADAHGIDFEYDGWMYIATELDGEIPVEIKAMPEGSIVPVKNVLFTVESTDPKVFWVASWMETFLMKVWYPSNIATRSYYVRKMLEEYADKTQDNPFVAYSYHNFGDRGSSSVESASIGGYAHLTQFMGTDNFHSLKYTYENYETEREAIGHSIPATEHSSTTSWGKENEMEMIMNHLEKNKGKDIIAAVCDSYDYFKCIDKITDPDGEFQEKINSDEYPVFVMRPDSGDPKDIVPKTLNVMEANKVPFTVNEKGFKVFNKMRIIWGDGINMDTMKVMLDIMVDRGYSTENIAFGSGGWLMQQHDRDTQGWAVKCSSITVDDGSPIDNGDGTSSWESNLRRVDVFKDPITAPNKKSKRGRVTTLRKPDGTLYTANLNDPRPEEDKVALDLVFKNGKMRKTYTLAEVRANSL